MYKEKHILMKIPIWILAESLEKLKINEIE